MTQKESAYCAVRAESLTIFHVIFALNGMKIPARVLNLAKPSHNIFTPTYKNFSFPDTCYVSSTFISVVRYWKINQFEVTASKHY